MRIDEPAHGQLPRRAGHARQRKDSQPSFDSVFQSRQHPLCPHRRFRPNISCWLSRRRHYRRSLFRRLCHYGSIFLRVLRSKSITTLPRYYSRSDSCPSAPLRASSLTGQVSLIHVPSLPIAPSPHTPRNPAAAFSRYPSARRVFLSDSGFTFRGQAHRCRQAESSSSSYGSIVHFALLPTSAHTDAVMLRYRPESVYLERTFTSLSWPAFRRTLARLRRAFLQDFTNPRWLATLRSPGANFLHASGVQTSSPEGLHGH